MVRLGSRHCSLLESLTALMLLVVFVVAGSLSAAVASAAESKSRGMRESRRGGESDGINRNRKVAKSCGF